MAQHGTRRLAAAILLIGSALLCSCGDSALPPLGMAPPFSPPSLKRTNSLKATRGHRHSVSSYGAVDDAVVSKRSSEKLSRHNLRRSLYLGEVMACEELWYEDKLFADVDSSSSSSGSMNACMAARPLSDARFYRRKLCPLGRCLHGLQVEPSDADELCVNCSPGYSEVELDEETGSGEHPDDQDGEDDSTELVDAGVESGESSVCPLGPVMFGDSGDESMSTTGIYERDFRNMATGEVYQSCVTIGQGSFGRAWRCTDEDSGMFVTVKEFFLDDRFSVSKAFAKAEEEMDTELVFGKFVLKNTKYCIPVLSGWKETISLGVGFSDEDDAEESSDSEDEVVGFRVAQGYGGANLDKIRFDFSGTLDLDLQYLARIRSYGVELFLSANVMRNRMKGLLEGLEYIHSQGVVHSDVKPTNLVFNNQIRFIDYGLSVCMSKWGRDDNMKPVATPCSAVEEMVEKYMDRFRGGTREYSPPERYLRSRGQDVFNAMNPGSYDIFSAGLIFMEWAAGQSLTMRGRMVFWLPGLENHALQFDRCSLKTFIARPLYEPSLHKDDVVAWYKRLYEPNAVVRFIQQNPWSRFGMTDLDDAKALVHLIRAMINHKQEARPAPGIALTHAFFTNDSKQFVCPNGRKVWFKYSYNKCMAKANTKMATVRLPRTTSVPVVRADKMV